MLLRMRESENNFKLNKSENYFENDTVAFLIVCERESEFALMKERDVLHFYNIAFN
jgi:hypothetical protein